MVYNRISVQGYKECQDDIQTVSAIAEDIRDALLDYQVGTKEAYVAVRLLKLRRLNRCSSNG